MRVYKNDGSFVEDNNTEFGWYFYEIMIDESNDNIEKINKTTRFTSKAKGSHTTTLDVEEAKNVKITKITPDVEIQDVYNVEYCVVCEENRCDVEIPTKEKLTELIDPCNMESKLLLSVINFSKYKSLLEEDSIETLMKRANVKSTNCKNLIKEHHSNLSDIMVNEIVDYHATKEDNMMSLMMELILTDVDCSAEDLADTDKIENEQNVPQIPQFLIETSDLGNSLPSCSSNKSPFLTDRSNYLRAPNREEILNSLGLSEEDKSIQSFCEETFDMHQELARIRKSFQEDANKVNDLLKQACALKNDLRETSYLDDIINLLEGDVEKVKLKKLPFSIFYRRSNTDGSDVNFII